MVIFFYTKSSCFSSNLLSRYKSQFWGQASLYDKKCTCDQNCNEYDKWETKEFNMGGGDMGDVII